MSIDLLGFAASAMDAQQAALTVAARNVAAAEAAGPSGNYERYVARFQMDDEHDGTYVRFTGSTPERGVNVDILTEMLAVMSASRSYEADASIFDVGKTLAEKTIDLGRLT